MEQGRASEISALAGRRLFASFSARICIISVAVLVLAALALFCCHRASRPNVLLVSIDTCRPDRIGAYGAAGNPTPNLDGLAREGARFVSALTPVPITLPAHVTMLSGFLPPWHGVHHNGIFVAPEGLPTLPKILGGHGWQTAAVIGSFVLERRFGLARGFASYDDRVVAPGGEGMVGRHYAEVRATTVSDRALEWLSSAKAGPFFLFLHYYDPHHDYRPPPPFKERFAKDPYQGEIAYVDAELGRVIAFLKESGQLDRTLVIVCSDHGESLFEHGEVTHGNFIYDSTIKVPLIMRWPGRIPAGEVISGEVGLEDVTPTVLDLLGIKWETPGQGRSQTKALQSGKADDRDRLFYSETYMPRFDFHWSDLFGVRINGVKFIKAPRPELYDLAADPGETSNLYEPRKGQGQAMWRELEQWIPKEGFENAERTVDDATQKTLRSLGYVGGSPDAVDEEASRRDPKDYIGYMVPLYAGFNALDAGRPEEARADFEKALAMDPIHVPIRLLAAECLVKMGRHEQAAEEYQKILDDAPENGEALAGLARSLLALGRSAEARPVAGKLLRVESDRASSHALMADVLSSDGDTQAARASCGKIFELDPAYQEAPEFCGKPETP